MRALTGMQHVAITVSDLERSAKFYCGALGMVPFGGPKAGGSVLPLVSPGMRDQITLIAAGAAGAVSETGHVLGAPGDQGGIDHFGFRVRAGSDLEALRARLEAAGGQYVSSLEIGPGMQSIFVKDPDGYRLQFTRYPAAARLYFAYLRVRRWIARRRRDVSGAARGASPRSAASSSAAASAGSSGSASSGAVTVGAGTHGASHTRSAAR